jgi:hypothetical protein
MSEDDIDYKQLWFNLCEEKKSLQLDNNRLQIRLTYYEDKIRTLENINNKLINEKRVKENDNR